ncbi:MAG: imidazole glycerol phosphate synthase subunit HisH [Nitrososphaeria archaeon]
MKFALLDYHASNMFSLIAAFKRLDVETKIVTKEDNFNEYSAIILPGVGNFSSASDITSDCKEKILACVDKGVPLLGICLGLQVLFESSSEGDGKGLEIFEGDVIKFPPHVKVPHIGWNQVFPLMNSVLLKGLENKNWVYFAHSYYPKPRDESIIKGITEYGIKFASVIEREPVFGTQFHPEKSSATGKSILKNFIEYVKR